MSKLFPHSLIGIVSVLPALLVMPAMGEDVSSASELNTALQTGADIVVTGDILDVDSVLTVSGKTNSIDLGGKTLAGVNDATTGYVFSGGSLTLTGGGTISGFYRPDTNPAGVDGSEYAILDIRNGAVLEMDGGDWTFSGNTVGVGALNTLNASITANVNKIEFSSNVSNSQSSSLRHQDSNTAYTSTSITANEIIFKDNEVKNVGDYGDAKYGGGTAVMNSGGTLELLGAKNTFTNNKMNAPIPEGKDYKRGGGAILNQSHEITSTGTNINSTMVIGREDGSSINTFSNNYSSTNGGAIMNRSVDTDGDAYLTINGTTTFANNTAALSGGAIYNIARNDEAPGHIAQVNLTNGTYTFTGNTANESGGAIYNSGEMTLTSATFVGNTASGTYTPNNAETLATYANGKGGAIFNSNTLIVGGTFKDNNAFHGGAIYNSGMLDVNSGAVFDNNYANVEGGAIANYGNLNIGNEVLFKNNKSFIKSGDLDVSSGGSEMGAAIYSEGTSSITRTVTIGDNVKFSNNDSYGGTAYFFGANNVNIGDGVEFVGNKGVAAAGLRTSKAGNGDTTITVGDNAKFTENEVSNGRGAAIHMGVSGTNLTVGDNVIISGNIGNAIRNSSGTAVFGANGIYSGNNAFMVEGNAQSGLGGVLRNEGTATTTFNGGLFTDNTAAKNGGAIYNEGTLTFAGENTFSGNTANGVANDIYNAGTLTFAAGSVTEMDGGINGNGALTIVDGATLNLGTASVVQNTMTLGGTVNAELKDANKFAFFDVATFDGTGSLNLTLKSVGTYNVFKQDVFDTGSVNVVDSSVFTYNWNDAGDTITVTTKSVDEIVAATDVKAEAANAVVTLTNAKDETAKQIGEILSTALAEGNNDYVEQETKKLAPEDKPITHSVASNVQNQVLTLTANRMSGGIAAGRAGGDEINADYGVWMQGLLNKSRYAGQFDGISRGFAIGADALINKVFTVGLGYAFSNADVSMSHDGGDMDIDSHTVFVYGQYKPNQWFINATLSNTISKYNEKAKVAGLPVETDYDVNAFGIQALTGYDFKSGLTPMVGTRYLHVSTDGHDRLIGHVSDASSSFLSMVGGAKYAFDIHTAGEVSFMPELHAMLTYDVISDKNEATVYVPGGSVYHVAGDRLSRVGGEFGLGLTTEWRGLELSVNYDLVLHKDYTSHTGMLKLRYEF